MGIGRIIASTAWIAALAAGLAACGEANPVRDAAQSIGLAGRPSPPAPFVVESRDRAPTGFQPVGVDAPPRAARRKTAEEFRALESQLEADRQRLEAEAAAARQAGATPPPAVPRAPQ
jgi:hypothetical protein